ncbi:hypothetical protein J3R82DRAFT_9417 [Butyriboletus roseoflavus]|nr:hypothetical protein J3R82DRAFT_9417 [Butyriboletus roseoflavus]
MSSQFPSRQDHSANSKTAKVINKLLKPKTQVKKPWEIYLKIHYKTCIQPEIGDGMSITDVNKKIHEMFENKSPEIKDTFYKMCKKLKQDTKNVNKGMPEGDKFTGFYEEKNPVMLHKRMEVPMLMGSPNLMDQDYGHIIISLYTGKMKDDCNKTIFNTSGEVCEGDAEHVDINAEDKDDLEDEGQDIGEGNASGEAENALEAGDSEGRGEDEDKDEGKKGSNEYEITGERATHNNSPMPDLATSDHQFCFPTSAVPSFYLKIRPHITVALPTLFESNPAMSPMPLNLAISTTIL